MTITIINNMGELLNGGDELLCGKNSFIIRMFGINLK